VNGELPVAATKYRDSGVTVENENNFEAEDKYLKLAGGVAS